MGKALDKEEILKNIYYNLNSSASYSGLNNIYEEAKKKIPSIKLNDVKEFLKKERTYTLFRPRRLKFKRLKTIPSGYMTDMQCDLCIFDNIKNKNRNYPYLLVCIDVLSRKIFVAPAKSKRSEDMIQSFNMVFEKSKIKPHKIYSDSGVEFEAKKMKKYFEDNEILKYVMHSPHLHAGVVERANRTIKGRLYKYFSEKNTTNWIDIIDKIVDNINNTRNRTTGLKPNQINFDNAQEVLKNVYKTEEDEIISKPKFKLGDIVRISKEKGKFEKSYLPNFTDELFKISKVNNTNPDSYRLEDLEGNKIKGIFYNFELVLTVKDTTYRIAKILKTRKRKGITEHFVSWVGFSDKHNSWIKSTDIVNKWIHFMLYYHLTHL